MAKLEENDYNKWCAIEKKLRDTRSAIMYDMNIPTPRRDDYCMRILDVIKNIKTELLHIDDEDELDLSPNGKFKYITDWFMNQSNDLHGVSRNIVRIVENRLDASDGICTITALSSGFKGDGIKYPAYSRIELLNYCLDKYGYEELYRMITYLEEGPKEEKVEEEKKVSSEEEFQSISIGDVFVDTLGTRYLVIGYSNSQGVMKFRVLKRNPNGSGYVEDYIKSVEYCVGNFSIIKKGSNEDIEKLLDTGDNK